MTPWDRRIGAAARGAPASLLCRTLANDEQVAILASTRPGLLLSEAELRWIGTGQPRRRSLGNSVERTMRPPAELAELRWVA